VMNAIMDFTFAARAESQRHSQSKGIVLTENCFKGRG
jgi:hypothetical protein